jgi:hypothetical protein
LAGTVDSLDDRLTCAEAEIDSLKLETGGDFTAVIPR